jgi:dnd system-associated protein 4
LSEQNIKDRVFCEERTWEIYKSLNASATKNSSITDQPFSEAKEVFMWAVSIGVHEGKKLPLEGNKEGLFFWNRLSADEELSILRLISIAETNSIEIIENEAIIQQLAEEYANYGIRRLNELLIQRGGAPLNNLVDLVRSFNQND